MSGALPWEWFDFREIPRAPDERLGRAADEGGADRNWRVVVGGRTIPFKLLRSAADSSRVRRRVLVMLHGMGLTIASFRGVAGHLLETHDLALVDYSSLACAPLSIPDGWPHGGLALRAMTETIWAVADVLGQPQVDLAGNSLGGALCLIAALQKPERVGRLVLSNPACYPQELPRTYRMARIPLWGEVMMALSGAKKFVDGIEYIGYVDKSRFEPELRKRYLRSLGFRRNRFRLLEMIRHLPADERDLTLALHVRRLGEIGQRVMLTWGEQDPLLVAGSGERLAEDLPACDFRRHPDLAHMPHEEAPDVVGREWAEFLRG